MKYEAIVSTGEVIVREMTSEEKLQNDKDIAEIAKRESLQAELTAEAAKKRETLLAKLGITEDEARLLLG